MSNQEQSPIIEACAVISAQITKIKGLLNDVELSADEVRALRRCELDMSKLEAAAWGMLCQLTTSDTLHEESEDAIRRLDEAMDALNPPPVHEPSRSQTSDFGFRATK